MGIGSTVRIDITELDAKSRKKGVHKLTFEIVSVREIDGDTWYRLSSNGGLWPHWALITTPRKGLSAAKARPAYLDRDPYRPGKSAHIRPNDEAIFMRGSDE